MKVTKFLKGMTTLTILSVIYINLQVQIYDLAYQGKKKEKEIRKLLDSNGNVIYKICKLKSANNLGIKLLDEKSNMQFLDDSNVVELETYIPIRSTDSFPMTQKGGKKPNLFASIFSLKSQAEANQ